MGMSKEEYIEYLRSDEWREKRKEFLEEADYECEECGERATEVHHLSYDNIGEEDTDDVEILCHECHKETHGKDEEYGQY